MKRRRRAAVAQMFGTNHHERSLSPSLVALLPDLIYHLDEPSDPLSLCTYHVSELASKSVKVVIGGDGGDELFGGYDRYYGNLYANHYARVPAALRRTHILGPALSLIPEAGWYKSVGHQLRWLQRLSFLSGSDRYAASLSYFYFDESMRASLFTPDVLAQLKGIHAEDAIRVPFDAATGDPLDHMLGRRQPGAAAGSPRHDHRPHVDESWPGGPQPVHGSSPGGVCGAAAIEHEDPGTVAAAGRNGNWRAAICRPRSSIAPSRVSLPPCPYILKDEYRALYERFLPDSKLGRSGCIAPGADRCPAGRASGQTRRSRQSALVIDQCGAVVPDDDPRPATRGASARISARQSRFRCLTGASNGGNDIQRLAGALLQLNCATR